MPTATVIRSRPKFIRRGNVKYYYPEDAMREIGMSRDTFYRLLKEGRIEKAFFDPPNLVRGKKKRDVYYITDVEIERVKKLWATWGRKKAPKKAAKGGKR